MVSVLISESTNISTWQIPGEISAVPIMATVRVERSVGIMRCLVVDDLLSVGHRWGSSGAPCASFLVSHDACVWVLWCARLKVESFICYMLYVI